VKSTGWSLLQMANGARHKPSFARVTTQETSVVGQLDFLGRRERTKKKAAPKNITNPPRIMAPVIEFGPGQEASNPTKQVPIPMKPMAIQRIRCLMAFLAGRIMQKSATGRPTRKMISIIL